MVTGLHQDADSCRIICCARNNSTLIDLISLAASWCAADHVARSLHGILIDRGRLIGIEESQCFL